MFYLNSTLNFGILTVLVFQLEVYYKVDRLQTGLTAQQKGTSARWYSNKTPLLHSIGIRRTIDTMQAKKDRVLASRQLGPILSSVHYILQKPGDLNL